MREKQTPYRSLPRLRLYIFWNGNTGTATLKSSVVGTPAAKKHLASKLHLLTPKLQPQDHLEDEAVELYYLKDSVAKHSKTKKIATGTLKANNTGNASMAVDPLDVGTSALFEAGRSAQLDLEFNKDLDANAHSPLGKHKLVAANQPSKRTKLSPDMKAKQRQSEEEADEANEKESQEDDEEEEDDDEDDEDVEEIPDEEDDEEVASNERNHSDDYSAPNKRKKHHSDASQHNHGGKLTGMQDVLMKIILTYGGVCSFDQIYNEFVKQNGNSHGNDYKRVCRALLASLSHNPPGNFKKANDGNSWMVSPKALSIAEQLVKESNKYSLDKLKAKGKSD